MDSYRIIQALKNPPPLRFRDRVARFLESLKRWLGW